MKLINIAAVACAAVFASSLAFAASPLKFEKADANGDGYVDAEEFAASNVKMEFSKLDKDGDGKLSKKEYSVALEEDCA